MHYICYHTKASHISMFLYKPLETRVFPQMAFERFFSIFLLRMLMLFLSSSLPSHAIAPREIPVGDKDGWVVKPSEDYNHWAQRNRFQVNDTLRFRYKKGSDSVLFVKKEDYDSCNTNNPKQKMDDGDSNFKLSDPGLYFFISGNVDNCKHGQRLVVLVMAVRHYPPSIVPPSQPPTSALLPHLIPSSRLVSPAPSPSSASSPTSSIGVHVYFGVGVWAFLVFNGFIGITC